MAYNIMFLFLRDIFMLYVWVLSLKNCLITMCMSGASGHQKRVSDTLELELQEVFVYDVGI